MWSKLQAVFSASEHHAMAKQVYFFEAIGVARQSRRMASPPVTLARQPSQSAPAPYLALHHP